MKAASILLFDFSDSLELGNTLKGELVAGSEGSVVILHEKFNGTDMKEAAEELSATMNSAVPDLLILLLSPAAQAAAPSIFSALLGQRHTSPVVAVPCSDEPAIISELFRLGANDYLVPPFRPVDVRPRLQRLLAYHLSRRTPLAKVKELLGFQQLVGESPALLEQIRKIPQVARCNACVLITGETGTGKEVCARAIHYMSPRTDHPFVPLNCGAIPIELLENELFGHEAGAFTSANSAQAGVISQATGGTLFLDEIDSLPLSAQVKLLRFLQDKEYRPLGSRKTSTADVRIIAASNARMEELLKSGKMRQDLFYRLNVLPLPLPPLRQRQEDIPLLARHFVAKYVAEKDGKAREIAPAALHKLSAYDWPGNVRELENVIERAVVLCAGDVIQSAEIDLPFQEEWVSRPQSFKQLKAKVVADFEQNYLLTVLDRYQGNIAQAARASQKNRRVFFRLMHKHHIRVERVTTTAADKPVIKVVIGVDKNVSPRARA